MSDVHDSHVSRRSFLKGAAVTAIAATATGAAAARLTQSKPVVETVIHTAPLNEAVTADLPTAVAAANNDPADLLARLAAQKAENVRLQAALEAAQQQLAALQQTNADESATAGAVNESLTMELESANEHIGLLAGLIALYEQLDDVELDTLLENGMNSVSDSVAALLDDVPDLEAGVALGAAALDDVEAHIPLLENGRNWLDHQTGKLQLYFSAVEKVLEKMVDRVGDFLEMLQTWFEGVQKWLPFNVGQRAIEVMETITILLAETPHTISGLTTNVTEPLDVWVGAEGEEAPLKRNVLKPMRENVLAKTSRAVEKARQVETVYHTQLDDPVKTAVSRQKTVRRLIADYRQAHQI